MPRLCVNRFNKRNIYLRYTIAFICFCAFAMFPFFIYGKSFLWSSDGMSQHYPTLLYSRSWLREVLTNIFSGKRPFFPNWTLNLGYGQDVIGNIINFRPFNFLWGFMPFLNTEPYLVFRSVLSLYLCGIAFMQFIKHKTTDHTSILLSTMMYCFCGFALFFMARHTFFLEMMFYLPLLLVGVERIFEKKFSLMFILMIFFSSLSYFYFVFMVTVPTVIYAFFYYFEYFDRAERSVKHFICIVMRFAWQYLIGVLGAAVALAPTVFRVLASSRGNDVANSSVFFWDFSVYENIIKGMVDSNEFGIYGHVGMSGLAVFLIAYTITASRGDKSKRNDLWQLLIYTVTMCVPLLTQLFNGLGGKTMRWIFVFSFWVCVVVAKNFTSLFKMSIKAIYRAFIYTGVYVMLYILLVELRDGSIGTGMMWVLFYLVAIFAFSYRSLVLKKEPERMQKSRKRFSIFLMCTLCLEIGMQSYEMYSPLKSDYISSYIDAGRVVSGGRDNPSLAMDMVEDDSLYRIDVNVAGNTNKYVQNNYGIRNNTYGIGSYYSFSESAICNYSLELGNSQQNVPFLMLGYDQRTILNELAGVKYYTTFESSPVRVPYGYSLVDSRQRTLSDGKEVKESVYRNDLALPLMYVYDSIIPRSTYDKLPVNYKEMALIQGAVTDALLEFPQQDIVSFDQTLYTNDQFQNLLREAAANSSDIEIRDNAILVKKASTSVSIPLSSEASGELYFLMENVRFESVNPATYDGSQKGGLLATIRKWFSEERWEPESASTISVSCPNTGRSDSVSLYDKTYQYAFGARDLAMNLCNGKVPKSITVRFSRPGMYYFTNAEVVVRDMEQYKKYVEERKNTPVYYINTDTNVIQGHIDCDQKKIVCIAVPYSKGWTATVNGQKAQIYKGNGMYMLVEVPAGSNDVCLYFRTPGFKIGLLISMATILLFTLALITVKIVRRIKRKKALALAAASGLEFEDYDEDEYDDNDDGPEDEPEDDDNGKGPDKDPEGDGPKDAPEGEKPEEDDSEDKDDDRAKADRPKRGPKDTDEPKDEDPEDGGAKSRKKSGKKGKNKPGTSTKHPGIRRV